MNKEELKEMRRKRMMGKNNPRWNNGNSDYPNHAELKRMRIKVLKRSKGECEICGNFAKIVHHKDGDKSNHDVDNLIALCNKCHSPLHAEDCIPLLTKRGRPTTKYNMLYGLTLREIGNLFGVSHNSVYFWMKNPKKKIWLENQLKEYKKKKKEKS